jgi:hypothetical protein
VIDAEIRLTLEAPLRHKYQHLDKTRWQARFAEHEWQHADGIAAIRSQIEKDLENPATAARKTRAAQPANEGHRPEAAFNPQDVNRLAALDPRVTIFLALAASES